MSLDQARGRDFLVLTKRSAASGDENGSQETRQYNVSVVPFPPIDLSDEQWRSRSDEVRVDKNTENTCI